MRQHRAATSTMREHSRPAVWKAGLLLVAIGLFHGVAVSAADRASHESPREVRGLLGAELEALRDHARVVGVSPNGPAAKAGLAVGDLVWAINGSSLRFNSDLELIEGLAWIRPGQPVRLDVKRDGKAREILVIPRAASEEELLALESWLDFERLAAQGSQHNRPQALFEGMVRQSPIDVVFRRTATEVNVSSKTPLPLGLDLRNRIVERLTEPLRLNDALTIRYSWENAKNALKLDVVESPTYYDIDAVLNRSIPSQAAKPPSP